MTAPAKSTAAKSTPAKAASVTKDETVAVDNKSSEKVVEETTPERIPTVLAENSILADFCKQYLKVVDEIDEYNKAVLAEKTSEWTGAKVMEKARELGHSDDASKINAKVKEALDKFEALAAEFSNARKNVLEVTAKELGISLSAVAERDSAVEGPLKERRKFASEIGSQLSMIAKMTTDAQATDAVNDFLKAVPLPAVGREQTRTFGAAESATTPKYRVTVQVTDQDGNVKFEKKGFTQAALALTSLYERGKALKPEALRKVWEGAGNTPENTVQPEVKFEDNDLIFTITKNN